MSVSLKVYSTDKWEPAVRNHLKHYNIRIVRDLTEKEKYKIDAIVKSTKASVDVQEAYARSLSNEIATVCNLAVLGLDKAEAIGRVKFWFGERIAKGDWRMEVE